MLVTFSSNRLSQLGNSSFFFCLTEVYIWMRNHTHWRRCKVFGSTRFYWFTANSQRGVVYILVVWDLGGKYTFHCFYCMHDRKLIYVCILMPQVGLPTGCLEIKMFSTVVGWLLKLWANTYNIHLLFCFVVLVCASKHCNKTVMTFFYSIMMTICFHLGKKDVTVIAISKNSNLLQWLFNNAFVWASLEWLNSNPDTHFCLGGGKACYVTVFICQEVCIYR